MRVATISDMRNATVVFSAQVGRRISDGMSASSKWALDAAEKSVKITSACSRYME